MRTFYAVTRSSNGYLLRRVNNKSHALSLCRKYRITGYPDAVVIHETHAAMRRAFVYAERVY